MNQERLLEAAARLPTVAKAQADAYEAKREMLVAEVNKAMLARPDVARLVGNEDNLGMMENNHANHARFVATILRFPDASTLVDTVLWVFRAYRNHGFSLAYWPAQLNAWIDAMNKHLDPADVSAIYPLYDWFIVQQPAFVALSDGEVKADQGPEPRHG